MNTNRTKIIATIGPASSSKEMLKALIIAGVDVCRINFSHGSHEDHLQVIKFIKEINKELWVHTAILADLQGPKLRIGMMENGSAELISGNELIITTEKLIGNVNKVYITYPQFPQDVRPGEIVMLDDGKLILRVIETNGIDQVRTHIVHGGTLSSKKGVNLPNTKVSLPCLTEKDLRDLDFALENNIEWIGLSFVRSASDIIELKNIIALNNKTSRVVAKIEKPEAIDDIDNIIKEADAVMVARGDLGVEVPMESVPLIQKMLVRECIKAAKPIIIATQMMESMITNVSPTRAEVNDVANSVIDGADAIMLSGETSVGIFPVKVIEAANKIISNVETHGDVFNRNLEPEINIERLSTDTICHSACHLAEHIKAKAIITMTHSGYTAIKVSSYRPKASIFVFTSNHSLLNTLSLIWGVRGFYYDKYISTDHTIADIKYLLRKEGLLKQGDYFINLASMPITEKGKTNMMKLSYVE
ncbi:MAG: pyruvate kinase [Bacteroidetes bacterium]|nr:pyruvate kinase [Bacteroidota bacterium]HET6245462.1 pyruvate kinase [Bacteroidia bacterium]